MYDGQALVFAFCCFHYLLFSLTVAVACCCLVLAAGGARTMREVAHPSSFVSYHIIINFSLSHCSFSDIFHFQKLCAQTSNTI